MAVAVPVEWEVYREAASVGTKNREQGRARGPQSEGEGEWEQTGERATVLEWAAGSGSFVTFVAITWQLEALRVSSEEESKEQAPWRGGTEDQGFILSLEGHC